MGAAAVMRAVLIVAVCICSVLEGRLTAAYDSAVVEKNEGMYCGTKVHLLSDREYFSCWEGPSPRGLTGGGSILWRDIHTEHRAVDGLSNFSRGVGFGADFEIKDAREVGGEIVMGALFGAAMEIYVRLGQTQYFIAISDGDWVTRGASIAMSLNGSIILIGSPAYRNQDGIVKFYRLEAADFTFQANLLPSPTETKSRFGHRVALANDGSIAAISSPHSTAFGAREVGQVHVFVYEPSNSSFVHTQVLQYENRTFAEYDKFGSTLAISSNGERIVSCASTIDFAYEFASEGACVVFSRSLTDQSFTNPQTLLASDQVVGNQFGTSVAISEDAESIAIGSITGQKVYLFRYKFSNQTFREFLIHSAPDLKMFGASISLSPDANTMLVGASGLRVSGFSDLGGACRLAFNESTEKYDVVHIYVPETASFANSLTPTAFRVVPQSRGFFFQPFSVLANFPTRFFFIGEDSLWKSYPVVAPRAFRDNNAGYGYAVAHTAPSNTLAISIPRAMNPNSTFSEGAVYLFSFNTTSSRYIEGFALYGGTGHDNSLFGSALAFHPSEKIILIGCERLDVNATSQGAVYIYSFSASGTTFLSRLLSPTPSSYGLFGASISLSALHLAVGAKDETSSQPLIQGNLHLFTINTDLSQIIHTQTLFLNDSRTAYSVFGATVHMLPDESMLFVGAPAYSTESIAQTGAIVVYTYDMDRFTAYDLIVPLDVQASSAIGEYMSISSDGIQVLIGSPKHVINGKIDVGQVYLYIEVGGARLNGSKHYELEEVLHSPDGVSVGSLYGMGVSIHPTFHLTLIGSGLSYQLDRDRPTVYIYEDRSFNLTTTSGEDTSDEGYPLEGMLAGLGGGLAGLFLIICCCCFCCFFFFVCVMLFLIILVALVVFVMMVGLGGILGGTGTVIGLLRERSNSGSTYYEMTIINEGMPEYKQLKGKEVKLIKQIGEGTFGVVFLGHWRGVDVAVKRLHASQLDEKGKEDFHHEAKVMGKMGNHPNLCDFIGAITEGEMMIVTRFYHNGSLYDYLIKNNTPADESTLIKMARGAACGLLHLHEEGIIHRDIATRNMLVSSNLTIVVTDFGISRVFANDDQMESQTQSNVGPVRWMSPEMMRSLSYSRASDCWMYGVMLWEMWERKHPFEGNTMYEVISRVKDEGRHVEIPTHAPECVKEVMEGVFKQDPSDRLTMKDIYDIFSQAIQLDHQ